MSETKGLKAKLAEPILNPKQMTALLLAIIYNVLADLLPLLMGEDVNIVYMLANLGISLGLYGFLTMMRAAGIKEVPNLSMINNIKAMFKNIIESLISKETSADEQLKMIQKIGEVIKDWDVLNDEYIKEFTEFFQKAIEDILKKLNS